LKPCNYHLLNSLNSLKVNQSVTKLTVVSKAATKRRTVKHILPTILIEDETGSLIHTLVDCGAEQGGIKASLAHQIGLKIEPTDGGILSVAGTEVSVVGKTRFNIWIDAIHSISYEVYVLEDCVYSLILGWDFWESLQADIFSSQAGVFIRQFRLFVPFYKHGIITRQIREKAI